MVQHWWNSASYVFQLYSLELIHDLHWANHVIWLLDRDSSFWKLQCLVFHVVLLLQKYNSFNEVIVKVCIIFDKRLLLLLLHCCVICDTLENIISRNFWWWETETETAYVKIANTFFKVSWILQKYLNCNKIFFKGAAQYVSRLTKICSNWGNFAEARKNLKQASQRSSRTKTETCSRLCHLKTRP